MIRKIYILVNFGLGFCLSVLLARPGIAQSPNERDTAGMIKLVDYASRLRFQKPDSFPKFADSLLTLARKTGYNKATAELLNTIGEFHRVSGHYPEALESFTEAGTLAETAGEKFIYGQSIGFKGITYIALGEYPKAIQHLRQAFVMTSETPLAHVPAFFLSNLGDAYDKMNISDSAMHYQLMAWEFARRGTMKPGQAYVLAKLGVLHGKLKNLDSAFYYFNHGLETGNTDVLNRGRIYYYLAELFTNMGKPDSARKYGRMAISAGYLSNQKNMIIEAAELLYKNYLKTGARDSAFYFLQMNARLKDSLFGPERFRKMQVLAINEQEKKFIAEKEQQELKSQLAQSQIRTKSRYRTIALSATILFIGLLAFFVWRNLRRQKKVNTTLQSQQEKITAQNAELAKTLQELKATQSQLIQSEKMASLGELTAGIAHEIQNPLNFVNNFSDVNAELIDELNGQLAIGNMQQAKEIAENIRANEEKIMVHGKRADAIVKSMLQHSRASTGTKEMADINQLVDEYTRLAYHGWRAKDKSFNVKLDLDLDPTIGKAQLAVQDIGRVILNVVNNAFYAVNSRAGLEKENYDPMVSVKTRKANNKLEVIISDNGPGIAAGIIDKIFQPFFTTKATGEGTGLGLSLSYDIIKSQGGEIKVETKKDQGTRFIIELPV